MVGSMIVAPLVSQIRAQRQPLTQMNGFSTRLLLHEIWARAYYIWNSVSIGVNGRPKNMETIICSEPPVQSWGV